MIKSEMELRQSFIWAFYECQKNIGDMVAAFAVMGMRREDEMTNQERIERIALQDALNRVVSAFEALQKYPLFNEIIGE